MIRIAVTGASGYIGRSLVSRLRRDCIDVVAITRSSRPSANQAKGFSLVKSYDDIVSLKKFFWSCDVVIHLAGLAHKTAGLAPLNDIDGYRQANVGSLVSVAKAASLAGVRRLIFVSSIGVNGSSTNGVPFRDADSPQPSESYSIAKLEAERALSEVLLHSLTDWVVLRPPLVYGPGSPGNLKKLIELASIAPVLPFGSIRSLRTLISIDNLVDALLIACFHPAVSRRVFVIADQEDIDVSCILKSILLGLGRGSWKLIPFPPFLIALFFKLLGKSSLWSKFSCELRVDSSSFSSATGWLPTVRPQDGLRHAAASTRVS